MKSRICILALSIFIHAGILALLPRWDSIAALLPTPRENLIRVTLHSPRSPEPAAGDAPSVTDSASSHEEAMERSKLRNGTPLAAASDAEMARTVDPSNSEPESRIETAPPPRPDIRPAKKPAPRRRAPERRRTGVHASPAPSSTGRSAHQVPAAAGDPPDRTSDGNDPERTAPPKPASNVPGDEAKRILPISEVSSVRRISPNYPLASRVRGEEGTTVLIAQVANGRVLSVTVEASSGFERLDAAARFAVQRWTFASKEPMQVRIPVSFRLAETK